MEQPGTDPSIENDVLHNPDHSRLTQEEIAKALAHHNKKHHPEQEKKAQEGKKQAKGK